eukprot:4544180-Prorocentrum_lima.AAC.1
MTRPAVRRDGELCADDRKCIDVALVFVMNRIPGEGPLFLDMPPPLDTHSGQLGHPLSSARGRNQCLTQYEGCFR